MYACPEFSIIIPVYNAEKYLKKCIDSVICQNYENFELILIDDGSNDSSGAICDDYAAKDSRIVVFHTENNGHTAARNCGILNSHGVYMLFVDSDDWILQGTLETCFKEASANNPDIITFGYNTVGENASKEIPVNVNPGVYDAIGISENILPVLMMDNNGVFFPRTLWGKAIKRQLAVKWQLPVPKTIKTGEDLCGIVGMVLNASKISVLPQCLYCYRITEGTVSRTADCLALRRCCCLADYLKGIVPMDTPGLYQQLLRLLVQQIYSAALRVAMSDEPYTYLKEEFRNLNKNNICRTAIEKADYSEKAKKLIIKQRILKNRQLWMIKPIKMLLG